MVGYKTPNGIKWWAGRAPWPQLFARAQQPAPLPPFAPLPAAQPEVRQVLQGLNTPSKGGRPDLPWEGSAALLIVEGPNGPSHASSRVCDRRESSPPHWGGQAVAGGEEETL